MRHGRPRSRSCIWRFNTLYWQALASWEQATGREYEQALPGGQSDARNVETARELIGELLAVWDSLDARQALPDQLYVIELGVGNGGQARTWLDAFAELDRRHGRDYYRRLHYLMGDYSAHVLDRAWQLVAHHGDHVSALVLDASRPQRTLGFLQRQGVLRLHLQRLRQPADRRAGQHRRPAVPGRGPRLSARRGRRADRAPPAYPEGGAGHHDRPAAQARSRPAG